jgi:hypothetical protein
MRVIHERPPRPPLARHAQALVAVALARLLARQSPQRICAVLRLVRRGAGAADSGTTSQARRDVVATSTRCAGRYCLERSLATVLLVRMRGSFPTWRTGVRTPPFAAHAWVEADGRPVGEPAEEFDYRPMLEVAPL